MAGEFYLQAEGLDKLLRVFRQLPKQTQSGIENELQAIKLDWINKAKADAPVDRATLKQSISGNVSNLSLTIIAQNVVAPYMEFGTKGNFRAPGVLGSYPAQFKGSNGSGINPIVALTEWVKRKGLVGDATNVWGRTRKFSRKDSQARTLAFLIYRKIKKEGLKPQPFLFTGKDGSDRVSYYFNMMKKNIAQVLKQIV